RARDIVEHFRAINQVTRRQDQRRMTSPDEQPPTAIIRPPRRLPDFLAIGIQPRTDYFLGNRQRLIPRSSSIKVAQPDETVDIILEGRSQFQLGKINPV